VAPVELRSAIEHPGEHSEVATEHLPGGRRLVAAVAVVLASILAVGLASQAPFRSGHGEAALRVLVDHVPGRQLEGQSVAADYRGGDVELVVVGDGDELLRDALPISGGFAVDLVDLDLDPAIERLEVVLIEGDQRFDLLDGRPDLEAGRRITVEVVDVPPPPGVAEGRRVFGARNLGACGVCHSTKPGDDGVGPSLAGVGTRAAERVPGMTAEQYLRESILDPAAYVVEGYRGDQMLPIYDERLSTDQLDALVEYLLSLTADPTADEEGG
jgi:mono/diheme cytochrome c family protein